MRKIKVLLVLALGLLPASTLKNRLLNAVGHRVHASATIDPVLLIKVGRLEIGPRTHIWSGSVFRDLRLVRLGEEVTVMRWNTVWALPGFRKTAPDQTTVGVLSVGDFGLITKGHNLDCSGGFSMGDRSAIAGRETLVYSHSYDPKAHTLSCAHTSIGTDCMLAARTTMAMGALLPDRSILAMGGVLMPGATKTETLYGGVPAKAVRSIADWDFLHRDYPQTRPPLENTSTRDEWAR